MDIEDVDFVKLVKDISIKHVYLPGSPDIVKVIHYCLFDEISSGPWNNASLAVKCQEILYEMGYEPEDLFWKRNNYGRGPECEKLLEDLELDYEYDGISTFWLTSRKNPQCDRIVVSINRSQRNQTVWSELIDILYEAKLNKKSWLYGYVDCLECFGVDDDIKMLCVHCDGTGHIKLKNWVD